MTGDTLANIGNIDRLPFSLLLSREWWSDRNLQVINTIIPLCIIHTTTTIIYMSHSLILFLFSEFKPSNSNRNIQPSARAFHFTFQRNKNFLTLFYYRPAYNCYFHLFQIEDVCNAYFECYEKFLRIRSKMTKMTVTGYFKEITNITSGF